MTASMLEELFDALDSIASQSPFRRGDECKTNMGTIETVAVAIMSQSPFRRGDECKRRTKAIKK